MKIYKITVARHLQNSWTILIYLIVAIAFPLCMKYVFGSKDVLIFVNYSLVGFSVFFIPQLTIHLRYYYLNKGFEFTYFPGLKEITIKMKNGVSTTLSFDEIKSVKYFKSFPFAEKRGEWFPWDKYNYSIMNLHNGSRFVITSLLVPDLSLPLEKQKIELIKTFYSFPIVSTKIK